MASSIKAANENLSSIKSTVTNLMRDGKYQEALSFLDKFPSFETELMRKQVNAYISKKSNTKTVSAAQAAKGKRGSKLWLIILLAIVAIFLVIGYRRMEERQAKSYNDNVAFFEEVRSRQLEKLDGICVNDKEFTKRKDPIETDFLCRNLVVVYTQCMEGVIDWRSANKCRLTFHLNECSILGMSDSDVQECEARVQEDFDKNGDKPYE